MGGKELVLLTGGIIPINWGALLVLMGGTLIIINGGHRAVIINWG